MTKKRTTTYGKPKSKAKTSKTKAKPQKRATAKTTTRKTAARKTQPRKTAPRKPRKKAKSPSKLRLLFRALFVIGIWSAILLSAVVLYYAHDLPGVDDIADVPRKSSIKILGHDNSVIGNYGGVKGNPIQSEQLPEHVLNALVATEDRRFFKHSGIDALGIARAMWRNLNAGRFVQGGSTITQQLAKNMFLTADKTIERKIKEAMLSTWLEQKLTKEEILSAYLNRVYFGAGAYGIDAAARTYFNKAAYSLTLEEGALLVGLLKAPSRYSPFSNPDLAIKRTKTVLHAMNDAGYLSNAQIRKLSSGPLPIRIINGKTSSPDKYFIDWVVNNIGSFVGATGRDIIVKTTLDAELQTNATFKTKQMFDTYGKTHDVTQAAFLAMTPDGAIRAMVGGKDYNTSRFNRATQAYRQPGSAFKPFVYLAGILQGYGPRHKIEDAPIRTGSYKPKNFADRYYGTVSVETALAKSLNTATIRLMEQTGIGSVIRVAKKAGLTSTLRRDMSLALGSSEVSLLELTSAYAVFANGGYAVYPFAITQITDKEGYILFQRDPLMSEQVFPRRTISKLDKMLTTTVREGTGKRAQIPNRHVRGKTGTSQDSRDAWFMGYTDNLVAGVWMGNDNNRPMKDVTGGNLPAELWGTIVQTAPGRQFTPYHQNRNKGEGLFQRLFQPSQNNPQIRGDNRQRFN